MNPQEIIQKFFPTILILLDVAAALVYAFTDGKWQDIVYWLAAAILTYTITFR